MVMSINIINLRQNMLDKFFDGIQLVSSQKKENCGVKPRNEDTLWPHFCAGFPLVSRPD